ncbi:hypothetical protein DS909_08290 [Phaeobacter gallaeciensis]|uniref:DUF4157 domain-containing protein n=1 Tax=Phaeobacter gallaeciensis TaxID=60890 RepID=A0A366X4Y7_9RHOB|nr:MULTISPECIES: hypothetical protein [Roseobacteraceae]MBT8167011.1 hypothetical protein [Falsiruegeria litorea]RBW57359.1 hypothetical protein DS909_08290 [Phaeobacter gallaeciensis]
MKLRILLLLVSLAACGRPLTDTEVDFAQIIHGDQLDLKRARLVEGAPVGSVTFKRKARPRVTCRERILPPAKEEIVTASPAAVALFNRVFFTKDWYTDNYLPEYPDRLHLIAAMLLAHELTHVWQWQNRDRTGYHPLRAAAEHGKDDDPYLFDLSDAPKFLDYGFEQQGAIVEEYVCCRALAPTAPRTQRLHAMLKQDLPVRDLPQSRESDVLLPWKDAELSGICA